MSTPVWDSGPVLVSLIAGYCDRCPRPPKPTSCVQLVDTGHSPITLCRGCFAQLAWEVGAAYGTQDRERHGH